MDSGGAAAGPKDPGDCPCDTTYECVDSCLCDTDCVEAPPSDDDGAVDLGGGSSPDPAGDDGSGDPPQDAPAIPFARFVRYFLGLGTWGFGGPIATVGYMQRDLVERRRWLDRQDFLNGVALGQTMPGPLAAQVVMWVGYLQNGPLGALATAFVFILPSFVLSGVLFPYQLMPRGVRELGALFPLRWYQIALRRIVERGAGLAEVAVPAAALALLFAVLLLVIRWRMKPRLG